MKDMILGLAVTINSLSILAMTIAQIKMRRETREDFKNMLKMYQLTTSRIKTLKGTNEQSSKSPGNA